MTPSSEDTVTIAAATHGVLNITTLDTTGTAADINITADGQIEYRANDAAGHIFDINGTNQLSIIDGMIKPVTDNDIDLGSVSNSFKDAHIQGTATIGTVTATNIDGIIGANTPAAGTFTTCDATTDFTIGSLVITDDSIVMTPSSEDTVTIAATTHGVLNITTLDTAGTAADINICLLYTSPSPRD